MRAREFIVEYKRDITAQRLGAALYDKFMSEPFTRKLAIIDNEDLIDLNSDIPEDQRRKPIVDQLLQKIENADPSTNKQYVPWMIRMYLAGGRYFEDIVSTLAQSLAKFHLLKQRNKLAPSDRDINTFKSASIFYNAIASYPDPESDTQTVQRGQAKEVYSDSGVRVIQPLDVEASCYYGRGTRWCTAATQGTNYFDSYNSQGPLYIILPKNPQYNGEKYQIHFASNQFMDENDDPVDPKALFEKRFPQLKEVFSKEVNSLLIFKTDQFVKELYDAAADIVLHYVYDVLVPKAEQEGMSEYLDWLHSNIDDGRGTEVPDSEEWVDYSFAERKRILQKYMNNPGMRYVDYDEDLKDFLSKINPLRDLSVGQVRYYTTLAQGEFETAMTPATVDALMTYIVGSIISDDYGEYIQKLLKWIDHKLVAVQGEYENFPGKRKFKEMHSISDDWRIGVYV